jgi:hypothetical protein
MYVYIGIYKIRPLYHNLYMSMFMSIIIFQSNNGQIYIYMIAHHRGRRADYVLTYFELECHIYIHNHKILRALYIKI